MSAPAIDWRALRVPLGLSVGALLILLGVLYAGSVWLGERERVYQRARTDLARAAGQYRSASDDTAVYEQYATRFREFENNGMIGDERRLAWIEALQSANRDLKLPTLRYEIAPREAVPLDRARVDTRYLELHRSTMTLRLGALHEGDVLKLLQSLANEKSALMETESCILERARGDGSISYNPRQANLEVRCRVHWYTLAIAPEEAA